MKWFNNMKIRFKFVSGFGIAIALSLTLAILGVNSSSTIDGDYTYILEFPQRRMDCLSQVQIHVARLRRISVSFSIYGENLTKLNELKKESESEISDSMDYLNKYVEYMNGDTRRDDVSRKDLLTRVENIRVLLNRYSAEVTDKIYELVLSGGDIEEIVALLAEGSQLISDLVTLTDDTFQIASDYVDQLSIDASAASSSTIMLLLIVAVGSVVLSLISALLTAFSITLPIRKLVDITNEIAKGRLNVNSIEETKDEIGDLVRNFFVVIDVVKSLVDDLSNMGHQHSAGEIEVYVEESKYEGSFRDVAMETNNMVKEHIRVILMFMDRITTLLSGDFNLTLEKMPGKKAVMNEAFDTAKKAILDINGEVNLMIKNIADGKVKERIDSQKYKGDWIKMMDGLNNVLQNFGDPLDEMVSILAKLSKGNFKDQMVGNYKGDFNLIKDSVNGMVVNIASYINEISDVLNHLANNNLDQQISRDYVGEFTSIKNAINNIIDKFNNVIGEITSATDQVAAGARQISESSMSLAQGATEQASSVEELTATVMSVNEKTQQNAEDSKRAATLSNELKGHAIEGNNQMKNMLNSMNSINEASNNISKIISIIKDISFQTNLLALNASIEAAHAGVHGAGFSVVADEVRSLAVKSQEAANDTTELIETSIQRVNEGTNIAVKTDEALEKIVNGVTEVSEIVEGISGASNEQALAISQINDGVTQIAQVVQSNSATSEESASAAQELSSQSEMLKGMVKIFNLK